MEESSRALFKDASLVHHSCTVHTASGGAQARAVRRAGMSARTDRRARARARAR